MNIGKIPGLRGEEEFNREYKALSELIGNLEERTESINYDRRREVDTKKTDLFDVNRTISNQIQETNRELEKKIKNNLTQVEDLEKGLDSLR